ncbi:ribose-phosphate diphosphokinase [Lysobacter xanthus]
MRDLLLHMPADVALAKQLGELLGIDAIAIDLHRFPDGESLVTLPADLRGRDVSVLASLRDPDGLALPLWFAAHTARELGARSVRLVAPYLAYMRQDRRFVPGQAISAPLFARLVEAAFDSVLTVDPHLHRIERLEAIYSIPAVAVSASDAVAQWIAREVPDAMLIGPDGESAQWVAAIASRAGLPFQVLEKIRRGDREVAVTLPDAAACHGRTPVLVDDIVSSGHTLLETLAHLRALALPSPVVVAIHAVFAGDAYERLLAAAPARVVSCDTLPHPSNAIPIAQVIAEGLRAMHARRGRPAA